MALSITEISRYGRQLILPEWGVKGIVVYVSLKMFMINIIRSREDKVNISSYSWCWWIGLSSSTVFDSCWNRFVMI